MNLGRGSIVQVELDPTVAHEQMAMRSCIVVSDPLVNADQRFPLIAVVPVTGRQGRGALYPALSPGRSGLRKPSEGQRPEGPWRELRRLTEPGLLASERVGNLREFQASRQSWSGVRCV